MNLYRLFEIYSNSGEITSSGIYMLRSALKRLYEAYNVAEGEVINEDSLHGLLDKLEEYLKSQTKTSKVIRENKYWVRRLIKFGVQQKYIELKGDTLTQIYCPEKLLSTHVQSGGLNENLSGPSLSNDKDLFFNPTGIIGSQPSLSNIPKIKKFKTPWIIKLTLLLLGVLIVGMVFIADLIHRQTEKFIYHQLVEHQRVIAQYLADGLQELITEVETEVNFLAQLPAIQLIDQRCQEELNKVYQVNKKYIKCIGLIDSQGSIHCGIGTEKISESGKLSGTLEKHILNIFKNHANRKNTLTSIQKTTNENPSVFLFIPVPSSSHRLQSGNPPKFLDVIIIVEIDIVKTAGAFIKHASDDSKLSCFLINNDQTILYHNNYKMIGKVFSPNSKSTLSSVFVKSSQNNISPQKDNYSQIFEYANVAFHEEHWTIVVGSPYNEIHPIKRFHLNIAMLMVGLICLLSLGSLIIFKVNQKRIMIEEEIKHLQQKIEMEDQIRKSDERLRAILDSIASDRISIIDKELKVQWANRVAFDNYGDIVGKKCHQVYKGLDVPCNPCPVQQTFKDGKIYSSEELALLDRDGKSILYLTSSSPIHDRQGEIISVVETSKDITERMRLQEEIKSKRDLLDAILTNMSDGIRVIDAKYNILFMNQNLIDLFGNQIGKKCYRVFMGRENPCELCALEKITKGNTGSVSFIKENVKKQLVEISASSLSMEKGNHSIIEVVRDITERKKLEAQLIESEERRIKELKERYRFGNIIGKSPKMQEIFELIQVVAQNSTTVLLLGESGTGKELIARAIHYNSPQHDKAFVEVCCSVLSENLLESELFGHVKGAFTGAIRDKIGRFEMADGGSVFLDEVGDISLSVQVKLLRVIQEREFTPVGGETLKKVNLRIIAATNKDLKKCVENKDFREDLYYRLNVVPIHIPPLRERMEDLPLLVNHFIEKFREKTNKPIHSISSRAMNLLYSSSWPGNIRELENAIEHAFVKCDTSIIQPEDLPGEIRQIEGSDVKDIIDQKDLSIGDLKKDVLIKVLNDTDWNPTESAKRLKISRATFYRWLQKYNIKKNLVS